jgi:hypothetical protein
MSENNNGLPAPRKRLFVGLISATTLVICGLLVLLWVVPFVGLSNIHPLAPWALGVFVGAAVLLFLLAAVGLVFNVALGKTSPFARRFRGVTVKFFLPLITILGRVLGIPKQRIRASFINVNNELVLSEAGTYRPEQILLLMPHCLQNSRCDRRLTYDINNCKRCGKCPITGLLELHDRYGVNLAIATGGTIARRIVVQTKPRLIVAVACERDLSSGIQDTYPLHVYGVLNERPHGPCLDTNVALGMVEAALRRFLAPEFLAEADAPKPEKTRAPRGQAYGSGQALAGGKA